jgi:hypothetical protein
MAIPCFDVCCSRRLANFAAWLFARRYRRQLLPIERRYFTYGCFLGFWLFDEFLKVANLLAAYELATVESVATAIGATIIAFALVWVIVRYLTRWTFMRYARTDPKGVGV